MLFFSLGPVLASIGAIALVLGVGIFALIATTEQRIASEHDPERAIQRLTFRLRHPLKARIVRVFSRGF